MEETKGPVIPVGDCVLWDGPKNEHGYGRYTLGGVRRYAHRDAYCEYNKLSLSDISGDVIMHLCDNPSCVNPKHLVKGTRADNVRDMDRKGRRRVGNKFGEDHGNARITNELANQIQMEYNGERGHQKELSVKYQIPTTTINRIVNFKGRFKHGT